jgi:hypothetical protein
MEGEGFGKETTEMVYELLGSLSSYTYVDLALKNIHILKSKL